VILQGITQGEQQRRRKTTQLNVKDKQLYIYERKQRERRALPMLDFTPIVRFEKEKKAQSDGAH